MSLPNPPNSPADAGGEDLPSQPVPADQLPNLQKMQQHVLITPIINRFWTMTNVWREQMQAFVSTEIFGTPTFEVFHQFVGNVLKDVDTLIGLNVASDREYKKFLARNIKLIKPAEPSHPPNPPIFKPGEVIPPKKRSKKEKLPESSSSVDSGRVGSGRSRKRRSVQLNPLPAPPLPPPPPPSTITLSPPLPPQPLGESLSIGEGVVLVNEKNHSKEDLEQQLALEALLEELRK